MTSGAVWKVILRFAFPLLIGNLLQQLYNVTDSVIVGQFLGKESLGGGIGFLLHLLLYYLAGDRYRERYVGGDLTVFRGRRSSIRCGKAFSSFFIFMLVAGVLLSIAGIIFAEPMFRLTNTPEDVIPQAVAYF